MKKTAASAQPNDPKAATRAAFEQRMLEIERSWLPPFLKDHGIKLQSASEAKVRRDLASDLVGFEFYVLNGALGPVALAEAQAKVTAELAKTLGAGSNTKNPDKAALDLLFWSMLCGLAR